MLRHSVSVACQNLYLTPPIYDHVRDTGFEKACAFIRSAGPSDPIVNILYIIIRVAPLNPHISVSFTDNRFFRENRKFSLWPFQDTIPGAKYFFDRAGLERMRWPERDHEVKYRITVRAIGVREERPEVIMCPDSMLSFVNNVRAKEDIEGVENTSGTISGLKTATSPKDDC